MPLVEMSALGPVQKVDRTAVLSQSLHMIMPGTEESMISQAISIKETGSPPL